MASIACDPNGLKRILFCLGDQRKTVRLGAVSKDQAKKFREMIEDILASKRTGRTSKGTDEWLEGLDDEMYGRLTTVDLVKPRAGDMRTLGKFIEAYLETRTDAKPGTLTNLKASKRDLVDFFGEAKPIRDIAKGDIKDFERYLASDRRTLGALGRNSVKGILKGARTFFRYAVEKRIIPAADYPFAGIDTKIKGSSQDRRFTITREMATKVLDKCPDIEWKLIFALARYGGLRCPSEHMKLRWADINFEDKRILVHSPKTEHHEGGESRFIPLFPELEPLLLDALAAAEDGAEYVIARHRDANANLRTQMHRIITRAGMTPWPKTFHNLRATRETELMDEFPAHVVQRWIGNTEAVSREHYTSITDEHWAKASKQIEFPCQQAAQNAAQYVRESVDTAGKSKKRKHEKTPVLQGFSQGHSNVPAESVPPRGFEPL